MSENWLQSGFTDRAVIMLLMPAKVVNNLKYTHYARYYLFYQS